MALITPNTCRSCVHRWHATPKENFCRRFPPTPTPIIVPSPNPPGFQVATTIATYPPVQLEWTCSEYKRGLIHHEIGDSDAGDN